MKTRFLIMLALAAAYHTAGYGASICDVVAVDLCNGTYLNGSMTYAPVACSDYSLHKVTGSGTTYCYYSCSECMLGALKQQTSVSSDIGCVNTITYNECSTTSLGGDCGLDCVTTRVWEADGTGYESMVTSATCNTKLGKCTKTKSYRCAAGYYGSSTNGTSGCTACDSGATSPAGSTSHSDCYIPSGSAFSDSSGSGSYTGDCYY